MSNPPTGNKTFFKDYDKYGFRRLRPDEDLEAGDIIQYVDPDDGPYHAVLVNNPNADGNDINASYSNGAGEYHQQSLYYHKPYDQDVAYRYIGTPSEREYNNQNRLKNLEVFGNEYGFM